MKLLQISMILVICFGAGCDERPKGISGEPRRDLGSQAKEVNDISRSGIGNDIERLRAIAAKLNRACGGGYVFIFGTSDIVGGNIIAVDYHLFDGLSDDAAAVMIAGKIAAKRMHIIGDDVTERQVLQIDELSGSIVSSAGFSSSGFEQWIEMDPSAGKSMLLKARLKAFMSGYQKEIRCVPCNKERNFR